MNTTPQSSWEEKYDEEFLFYTTKKGNRYPRKLYPQVDPEKMKSFIHKLLSLKAEEVIGKIGAKLLARHSPQAVLDDYFSVANEELEQYEKNN